MGTLVLRVAITAESKIGPSERPARTGGPQPAGPARTATIAFGVAYGTADRSVGQPGHGWFAAEPRRRRGGRAGRGWCAASTVATMALTPPARCPRFCFGTGSRPPHAPRVMEYSSTGVLGHRTYGRRRPSAVIASFSEAISACAGDCCVGRTRRPVRRAGTARWRVTHVRKGD